MYQSRVGDLCAGRKIEHHNVVVTSADIGTEFFQRGNGIGVVPPSRIRRDSFWLHILVDLAVGIRLLQFGDARVGYIAGVEVEVLQVRQAFDVYQPSVGDLDVTELEIFQIGHVLEVDEARVSDLGAVSRCGGVRPVS